ncbi:hypothetical protein ACFBZI_11350 [Moraxella sp. ZJ142]|uniref:hypothetical protein n=1 Tax=Moraxella marmotae TaxID=3344520 RepID=UPI0035D4CEB7
MAGSFMLGNKGSDSPQARMAEIAAKAERISKEEATALAAGIRLGYYLGCHNALQPVEYSPTAGTIMPVRVVQESAIGIGKTPTGALFLTFLLQQYLWEIVRPLIPIYAVIEEGKQSLAIRMQETIAGEHKPSSFILSFPIRSNNLWSMILSGKHSFVTLGWGQKQIDIGEDGRDRHVITCKEIQTQCVPIMHQKDLRNRKGAGFYGY